MSEPDPFKISEAVIDLWRCYTIERDMAKELEAENARLKAEVERLRASSFVTAVPAHQYERIVKAGDAMAEDLLKEFGRKEMLKYQPYQDWNAAKNGWDDDNESKQP